MTTTTETPRRAHLVTTYSIAIKQSPERGWSHPEGWGPYYTRAEGEAALAKASDLWMSARLDTDTERRDLTAYEVESLRRLGATVASLGRGRR